MHGTELFLNLIKMCNNISKGGAKSISNGLADFC